MFGSADKRSNLIRGLLSLGLFGGLLLFNHLGKLFERLAGYVVGNPPSQEPFGQGVLLRRASHPGISVSETVDRSVPKRLEGLDQYVLAERNPDTIHDQEPNEKILDAQVTRLLDGGGALSKSIGQGTRPLDASELSPPLRPPFGMAFPM